MLQQITLLEKATRLDPRQHLYKAQLYAALATADELRSQPFEQPAAPGVLHIAFTVCCAAAFGFLYSPSIALRQSVCNLGWRAVHYLMASTCHR